VGLSWSRRTWMALAAASGFVAVAMGAFAAHGITDPQAKDWIRTAANYQLMHSISTFACATFMQIGARRARFAPGFFLSGIVLFSGSLYAMAMGGPRMLGAITPIGGILLLIGWAVLVWAALTVDPPEPS
jgi:uncharacterized membrane protein YgdD (TMEM256/DUF423 family)